MLDFLTLATSYYSKEYQLLLTHLSKNSLNVLFSDEEEHLPLLILEEDSIHLWYRDQNVSPYPFVFSEPEEIFLILQFHFFENKPVYISKKKSVPFFKDFLENKINESLQKNDQEAFSYWRNFLHKN